MVATTFKAYQASISAGNPITIAVARLWRPSAVISATVCNRQHISPLRLSYSGLDLTGAEGRILGFSELREGLERSPGPDR